MRILPICDMAGDPVAGEVRGGVDTAGTIDVQTQLSTINDAMWCVIHSAHVCRFLSLRGNGE
jgi:hypothetical protein